MPVLHIEGVPADLYERLQERATAQKRPLTAEVILLLQKALELEESKALHRAALADLRARRWTPPPGAPESLSFLREDRDR